MSIEDAPRATLCSKLVQILGLEANFENFWDGRKLMGVKRPPFIVLKQREQDISGYLWMHSTHAHRHTLIHTHNT